jgi:hypothetical protein
MTKPLHVNGQTYNHHITEHKAAITLGIIMGTFLGTFLTFSKHFVYLKKLKFIIFIIF